MLKVPILVRLTECTSNQLTEYMIDRLSEGLNE